MLVEGGGMQTIAAFSSKVLSRFFSNFLAVLGIHDDNSKKT